MPISALQHRISNREYQNNIIKKNNYKQEINLNSLSIIQDQIKIFGSRINQVINTHEEINRVTNQNSSITASLLMLLCHIRFLDNPILTTESNPILAPRNVVPYSNDGSNSDLSHSDRYFDTILSPLTNAFYKTGQFISRHDPLVFPLAEAAILPEVSIPHYEIKNESINEALFYEIFGKNISDMYSGRLIKPVIMFHPTNPKPVIAQEFAPAEISMAESNAAYEKYIAENCHVITKTNDGTVVGNTLLTSSEFINNIIREAAKKIFKAGGVHETPDWMVDFSEGMDTVYDITLGIMTAGVYPIVKYSTAKSLEVAGHAVNGDKTCLMNALNREELAALLMDTEIGITDRQSFSPKLKKIFGYGRREPFSPTNLGSSNTQKFEPGGTSQPAGSRLKKTKVFTPSGMFVHQNVANAIHTEKYITVTHFGSVYEIKEKNLASIGLIILML